MSLINDAIKKANKANKDRTAADAPPAADSTSGMHAADGRAAHPAGGSMTSMLLIAGIVVFVLLGGAFLFLSMRGGTSLNEPAPTTAAPKVIAPAEENASAAAGPARPVETGATANPVADALNNPLPPTFQPRPGPTQPTDTETTTPATAPTTVAGTGAPATQPAGPRPFPELKLQGIYYRLNNPSVMINGHTLEIGDLVEGVRVIQIERKEVTLELDGQKKALRLQ